MTSARIRWWLVIAALALGAGAAIVRAPVSSAAHQEPVYRPPSGC